MSEYLAPERCRKGLLVIRGVILAMAIAISLFTAIGAWNAYQQHQNLRRAALGAESIIPPFSPAPSSPWNGAGPLYISAGITTFNRTNRLITWQHYGSSRIDSGKASQHASAGRDSF